MNELKWKINKSFVFEKKIFVPQNIFLIRFLLYTIKKKVRKSESKREMFACYVIKK